MKKMIGVLALAFMASMAMASETWMSVIDADDGTRMLIDAESYMISRDKEDANSPVYLGAKFRYVVPGSGPETPFVLVTDATTCMKGQGELIYRTRKNDSWVTAGRYWWSTDGTKMYDTAGKTLCAVLKAKLEKTKSKSNPNQVTS